MRILALLLCAVGLYGQSIPMGSVGPSGGDPCPTPLLEMTVGSGSATWDGSDGSGTATLTGTTIQEDPAMSSTYVLDMDGTNDDFRLGTGVDNLAAGAGFGASMWVRQDVYEATTGQTATFLIKGEVGASNLGWQFQSTIASTGRLAFTVRNTSDQNENWATNDNVWDPFVGLSTYTHVGFKASGCATMACSVTIYINGSPVTTNLNADQTGTPKDDSTYTLMGGTLGNAANDLDARVTGIQLFGEAPSDDCFASLHSGGRP